MPISICLSLIIALISAAAAFGEEPSPPPAANMRSFHLGFTPLPPDYSFAALDQAYDFISQHGDIIAHHFDNGVPWQEALDGTEFSDHLMNDWEFRRSNTPADLPIYLAITPLNWQRDGLAPYRGVQDNLPLPQPWTSYRLDDPHVKQAFLNYVKRAVEFFQPKYLAIGIETNILLAKAPGKWREYRRLHTFLYGELKQAFPQLIIFPTIQYEYLRGIAPDAVSLPPQLPKVKKLVRHGDLLALSTYHYGVHDNPVTKSYFTMARGLHKPIAIAETGANSKDLTIFNTSIHASETDQNTFVKFILKRALAQDFVFVINFVPIDYNKLLPYVPIELREVAKAWVHTGLRDSDGINKPALGTWDKYLQLKLAE